MFFAVVFVGAVAAVAVAVAAAAVVVACCLLLHCCTARLPPLETPLGEGYIVPSSLLRPKSILELGAEGIAKTTKSIGNTSILEQGAEGITRKYKKH